MDVIIPLGNGSKVENDELRMLLRSLETNLEDLGKIYLVTMYCPDWINKDSLTVVEIPDKYKNNKDANLHEKTLTVIEKYDLHDFLWCADDNVLMQRVKSSNIPIIRNHRQRELFSRKGSRIRKWHKRVMNTLEWADSKGVHLDYNFECHAPQCFDGVKLLSGMKDVDYVSQPGLTIYTTWRVVTDSWQNAEPQPDYKMTFESSASEGIQDLKSLDLTKRMFIGYNDHAVEFGLIDRLKEIFPGKSKYEV